MRTIAMKMKIAWASLFVLLGAGAQAETVLITGANQRIGYEFARQYAEKGRQVIATHRRSQTPGTLIELQERYPHIRVEVIDVVKPDTIAALAEELEGVPIDVLINNAG